MTLRYDLGAELASSGEWAQWRARSEFKAIGAASDVARNRDWPLQVLRTLRAAAGNR